MKYLNALHTRVNNPLAIAQESADSLAMEGLMDTVKEKWDAIKEKFKPSDAAKAAKQIEALAKVRKDLVQAKSALSQSGGADHAPVTVKMSGRNYQALPVVANTSDELIAGLAAWRKKTNAQIAKISTIKDEAQAAAAMKELQAASAVKGKLADEMSFNRAQTLKLIDEMIAVNDTMTSLYKLTVDAQRKAKSSGVSMEGYGDVESVNDVVAMEGVGEGVWGVIKLYWGYCIYCFAVLGVFTTVGLIITVQVVPALLAAGVTYALAKAGNYVFMSGVRSVKKATSEDAEDAELEASQKPATA